MSRHRTSRWRQRVVFLTASLTILTSAILLVVSGSASGAVGTAAENGTVVLGSPAVDEGDVLPIEYTHVDRDVSPPLRWSGLPAGTVQLALVFDGPYEGQPSPLVHWLIYRIPATAGGLPERLPRVGTLDAPADLAGVLQGNTAWGDPGYRGPAVDRVPATYRFRLYAIDADLALRPGLDEAGLLAAIEGHVLGTGELHVVARR